MSYSDSFWTGFLVAYFMIGGIGMTLVVLTKSVELLREKSKLEKKFKK